MGFNFSNFKPWDGQKRMIDFIEKNDTSLVFKAREVGATTALAYYAAKFLSTWTSPQNISVISVSTDASQHYSFLIVNFLKDFFGIRDFDVITNDRIHLSNGSQVKLYSFLHMPIEDAFMGMNVNLAIFDEFLYSNPFDIGMAMGHCPHNAKKIWVSSKVDNMIPWDKFVSSKDFEKKTMYMYPWCNPKYAEGLYVIEDGEGNTSVKKKRSISVEEAEAMKSIDSAYFISSPEMDKQRCVMGKKNLCVEFLEKSDKDSFLSDVRSKTAQQRIAIMSANISSIYMSCFDDGTTIVPIEYVLMVIKKMYTHKSPTLTREMPLESFYGLFFSLYVEKLFSLTCNKNGFNDAGGIENFYFVQKLILSNFKNHSIPYVLAKIDTLKPFSHYCNINEILLNLIAHALISYYKECENNLKEKQKRCE